MSNAPHTNFRVKRICFFASYFRNDTIPAYLKLYLTELNQYCDKIILMNSFDYFLAKEQAFIANLGIEVRIVENKGHDFGMWNRALVNTDTTQFEEIIFVNDSCLLIQPLEAFFSYIDSQSLDFYGMINSNERQYHIQSYFLGFNKKALPAVEKHFRKHGFIADKRKLIKKYELGLTAAIQKNKLHYGTFFKVEHANNPLFHDVSNLISAQFPLVKKQLIFETLAAHDIAAFQQLNINLESTFLQNLIKKESKLQNVDWIQVFENKPIV